MKALTIKEPWASLIINGYKKYEFRSWKTNYRGKVLIHAGNIEKEMLSRFKNYDLNCLKGVIIGEANITDCIKVDEEFNQELLNIDPIVYGKNKHVSTYAFKLENIQKYINPIPYSGKLGFWNCDLDIKEIVYNDDLLKDEDVNNIVRRAKIVIINSKDEFVLCESSNNYFFLGGHVDNENDIECLKREIKEESGVKLKIPYFKPFMTIKYYNKNYPEGKNTLSLANYYYLKYDLEVNLNNISLTNEEKDNGFKIVKIPKDQILEYLNNSLTKATRINVTKDTIKVLEEVLNNKTLN